MEKHFVEFYSPGTFFSESTEKAIDSWDVDKAKELAKGIQERHAAVPYGFRFKTRARGDNDLDSKVVYTSGIYFLGGTVYTLEEVEARNDPDDRILISNMRTNGYNKIIENTNSWKSTLPFDEEKDTLLDW